MDEVSELERLNRVIERCAIAVRKQPARLGAKCGMHASGRKAKQLIKRAPEPIEASLLSGGPLLVCCSLLHSDESDVGGTTCPFCTVPFLDTERG